MVTKENNPPKKRKSTKIVNYVEIENNKINFNNKRYSIINKNNNNAKKNKINILNMNNINDNRKTIEEADESKKIKIIKPKNKSQKDANNKSINLKKNNTYALILRNANDEKDPVPYQSDYISDNFDYNEAIMYKNRSYCRIYFIILIGKENVLNMIFFNPPLEFKPIRFAIFIFNFACD